MRKILVVITTTFIEYEGTTTVMLNYYRNMNREGITIDFASTNKIEPELDNELKANGSHYYNLGSRRKGPVQYAHKLSQLLKKERYDVIHVNGNSATVFLELYIASIHRVSRKIVHIHTSKGNHKYLHQLLQPLMLRLCDVPIACSQKAGYWAYKDRDFTVLNNAIDTKMYTYDKDIRKQIREQLAISEDDFVIGHVGSMGKVKNHSFLVDVFYQFCKQHRNSYLLLVGDGILRKTIEDKVKKLGLVQKVIFTGTSHNVSNYLFAMDVFVFPSLWEGLPLSLIEAQASGLPCIASAQITAEANVTQKIQYLSLSKTANVWADKIDKLMQKDRISECESNLRRIEKGGFDIYKNANVLRNIYL